MRIGSLEHRDLICREFINGFKSYEATALPWPELNATGAARLRTIPFWSSLISAERIAAERARRMARDENDHATREALGLLAYEKTRTASLIECMMQRYGIKAQRLTAKRSHYGEWGFMLSGAAETYDVIFAFGLFRLAVAARFLPSGLIAIFEQVVTEEARHALFFRNWAILRTRYAALPRQPLVASRRVAALTMRTLRTVRIGARIAMERQPPDGPDNFVAWTLAHLDGEVSLRRLIEIGLKEFAQRMEDFDPRLPRPYLAPKLLRLALPLLKRTAEQREKAPSTASAPERPLAGSQQAEPQARDRRIADDRLAGQRYAHNQYSGLPTAAPHRRRRGWAALTRRPSRMPVR
jgi:hypothetical protein